MNTYELMINIQNNLGRVITITDTFQADDLETLVEDLRYDFAEDYKTITVELIN